MDMGVVGMAYMSGWGLSPCTDYIYMLFTWIREKTEMNPHSKVSIGHARSRVACGMWFSLRCDMVFPANKTDILSDNVRDAGMMR